MTKLLSGLAAALLAAGLISTAALAAPPKGTLKPAKKTSAANCPFCKMPLSVKMTKETPVAIKMHGKTYYTCAPCKAKVAAMNMKKPMAKTAPKTM